MPNTINGIGKPIFYVLAPDGSDRGEYYEFPFCNIGGVNNELIKDSQVIELENGRLEQDVFGYRNKFILDFSQMLTSEYCLKLQTLLNREMSGHRIFCKPTGLIKYEIIFSNSSFLLKLLPSAGKFVGMQGIVIELLTVELSPVEWQTTYESGDAINMVFDDLVIVGDSNID